ncbi:E3 ubiquitin ligase BIG BROTHER-related-like [Ipomoea triloba]|uniref:E3 ubiquitin ligase BIG BROTHER-related-like n=1 Tax=Ipomoea triloba TaxID=35885 RepID=UPI00125E8654|nr:E3 ubiquitin ligase BIG BROTHER-related-like [Ipomoea triloba]
MIVRRAMKNSTVVAGGGAIDDAWEEVDLDEFSYEELLALDEVVGTESRGLSADTIASLPSMSYKSQNTQDGANDSTINS